MELEDLGSDPISAFRRWYGEAVSAREAEPEAMSLATCTREGVPSVRFVLLKAVEDAGFVFYTNDRSRKGRELLDNPRAALVIRWRLLGRQVRAVGTARRLPPAASDSYFSTRERGSQIGAWASDQSEPIPDRAALEKRADEAERRFAGVPVRRPEWWGGWLVTPEEIEFWQGRPNRLHDRISFSRRGDGWVAVRLAP